MILNQTMNLAIVVKDDKGVDVTIGNAYGSLNPDMSFSIGFSTYNKELVVTNAELVKEKFTQFEQAFRERAVAEGFPMF